ncbi:MAG: ATP-binding protein [Planctomycetota bacterium]
MPLPAAPIPTNEAERLAALLQCRVLDTDPESAFDDLTRLAARLLDVPIALVSLVDSDRQWFKSRVGLDAQQTPRSQAFCAYVVHAGEPLVIPDATLDARVSDNPLVVDDPRIRFYAGYPLLLSSGEALGTLCAIDFVPRTPTQQQLDDLCSLAAQASTQLELRRKVFDLEVVNERVQRASEAKSVFLANMSHEIRTPMTAILGYADVLATDPTIVIDENRHNEAVGVVRRNAHHLLAIINDILDMSKLEAGRLAIERLDVSISELIGDVEKLLRVQAEAKGLTLDVRVASPIPERVTTDPTRLKQILLNLVSNAIKFTSEGGVTVDVSDGNTPGMIRFEVRDTGVGMSPEQLERVRLFEAFTQADATMSRRFGGSGLGLRISKALAALLGGDLEIESIEGEGTTSIVTVCAPACTKVEPGPGALGPFKSRAGKANSAGALEGVRILLAEDGLDNQRLFMFHLERAGAEVTLAINGREAIEAVRAPGNAFDIVLMDMQMPEVDGYEATRVLRSDGFEGPILALTAHAMSGDRERCLAAGCDEFLTKPINRDKMIEAIGSKVRVRRAA